MLSVVAMMCLWHQVKIDSFHVSFLAIHIHLLHVSAMPFVEFSATVEDDGRRGFEVDD